MIFSDKYAKFIMPTAKELAEEKYISSLSSTEKELYCLKCKMLDGKILRIDDDRYNPLDGKMCYEDSVSSVIFFAVNGGEITDEEGGCLYNKYVL